MTIDTLWTRLLGACGHAAFASRLWRKRGNEKDAHKAGLHEWENEGRNLAPARHPKPSWPRIQPDGFRKA